MTFNSYQRPNTTEQNYQYNGKELQDELDVNWLDYGARMYMADIGRFFAVDNYADKYVDVNPYQYALNNPMYYVDINGDSVDVSGLDGKTRRNLKKDLANKTGLKLKVKGGQLVYKTDSKGNAKTNNSDATSKSAKTDLMAAIDHDETVSVTSGDNGNLTLSGTNNIELDRGQILAGIDNTGDDLNNTTMGFALSFMHELYHTNVGGDLTDPEKGNRATQTGDVVDKVNNIRSELGDSYGQRTAYGIRPIVPFNRGVVNTNNPYKFYKKNLVNRIRGKLGLLKLKKKY